MTICLIRWILAWPYKKITWATFPISKIIWYIRWKTLPAITYHPFLSTKLKYIRSFLWTVRNFLSNYLPLIQVSALCCINMAVMVFIFIPHLVNTRTNLIHTCINHALRWQLQCWLISPVPKIFRCIVENVSWILPCCWDSCNIGYIHMICSICLKNLWCPKGIMTMLNTKIF